MEKVNNLWDKLIGNGFFTEEELQLVTNINGYNEETLNDCIYARYGYHNLTDLMLDNGYLL